MIPPPTYVTWYYPCAPGGTEDLDEEALAALVTRDAMIGVTVVTTG